MSDPYHVCYFRLEGLTNTFTDDCDIPVGPNILTCNVEELVLALAESCDVREWGPLL